MSSPYLESDLQKVQARLQSLSAQVGRYGAKRERKRKGFLGVGIVLTVVCVVSLSSLTSLAFQLDTEAVTQIGRLQVEKHLPNGRATLASYMKAQAPSLVNHAFTSFLDLLPQFRGALVQEVEHKLVSITDKAEEELDAQMAESIHAARVSIDREFPNGSDVEKLSRLVDAVAGDFKKNMEISLDVLYPQFAEEMDRVHSFLQHLGTCDDKDLTEREKTQKDLVQTLLKLMAREKSGQ